ncbi:MAG: pyruvate carboxylase [Bacillota bacterium]
MEKQKINKVLVANRGEIAIRVIRACKELGIRTVAIYHDADKKSLFKTKADEAYQIGQGKTPLKSYLAQDEIINLALNKNVDAIHPGYGFLSENADFAAQCEEKGLIFIGPNSKMLDRYGDKIKCKNLARENNIPVIPGSTGSVKDKAEIKDIADEIGFPLIIKAAAGGGGRGMRLVNNFDQLDEALASASKEADRAFSSGELFIEKYLASPRHIEVQILTDNTGRTVHLFERDCSIQRRYQKIIEYGPAFALPEETRQNIRQDAVKLIENGGYLSAGTVEFLVDKDGNHYFIEVNPRIQVEHTVTEMITGIDIVQAQILIAQGYNLSDQELGIPTQNAVKTHGFAVQARVTTEDPRNDFRPDTGRISLYRTGSGNGIRLDGGNGYTGAEITPYFDSLIVKVIGSDRTFKGAINKTIRSLEEMKIQGVKTNRDFLINLLNDQEFREGRADTGFLDKKIELITGAAKIDQEIGFLDYLGDIIVNKTRGEKPEFDTSRLPELKGEIKPGSRDRFKELGSKEFCQEIKTSDKLLITDTTLRDAHQSLLATRMRTYDMLQIADYLAEYGHDLFSLEMWGGATFDVSYRFLKESPWERLRKLREKIPNILFQMLIRGANAVGYKNYPDNLIKKFVQEAAASGIDLFRIFDALNWWPNLELTLSEVKKAGALAEVSICYTGDILDPDRTKYDLNYYTRKAREVEEMGADILCIKDMAGLLKPYAAKTLISALKAEVDLPIHLHTHDTSGNGLSSLLQAAEAGVDIVDLASNSMASMTSQPALNSMIAALDNTERDPDLDYKRYQAISDYWQSIRPIYHEFESDLKSGAAEIYRYEIPGGQYSNLKPQIESLGLSHRFKEIKEMYRQVNFMLGDIIKVTPTSKAVGDLAIFMVQNNLTPDNILEKAKNMSFPDSVVAYFKGLMGQPEGGFPPELQKLVLKDEEPLTVRPGLKLEPVDFDNLEIELAEKLGRKPETEELLSKALYPKVFDNYVKSKQQYGDLSKLSSDLFFHGLQEGEIAEIEVEEGRTILIKYISIREGEGSKRYLTFEVNGQRREVEVRDKSSKIEESIAEVRHADPDKPEEIGAGMPGTLTKIKVKVGEKVKKGQQLFIMEAMKMETEIVAPINGTVSSILVSENEEVQNRQLIMVINQE